ncbi:ubiquitin carboxyl-terminal hydrolase, partial [Rhizophlyctis rosea]
MDIERDQTTGTPTETAETKNSKPEEDDTDALYGPDPMPSASDSTKNPPLLITASAASEDTSLTTYSTSFSSFGNGSKYGTSYRKEELPIGATGLQNLGNTCFMNSALQCLSNTSPLTQFFLSGRWKDEINEDNPLGMKGEIAEAYAKTIKELWDPKHPSSIQPRLFKNTIGRFNSMFQGYGQQDSQELLQSLLDGLHEDLNRIKKKPYIEVPDMDDKPDEEIAQTLWDIHSKRNDSVIVDHFQGQYKSRLQCPECGKLSITFDPYMFLSLPIPERRVQTVEVIVVPQLKPGEPAEAARSKEVRVTLPKGATIKALKLKIAKEQGWEEALARPSRVFVAEVYNHALWKVFQDHDSVSFNYNDKIYVVDGGEPDWDYFDVPMEERTQAKVIYMPAFFAVKTRKGYESAKAFGVPLVVPLPSTIRATLPGRERKGRTDRQLEYMCCARLGKMVYRQVVRALRRYAQVPLWKRKGSDVNIYDVIPAGHPLIKEIDYNEVRALHAEEVSGDLAMEDEGEEYAPLGRLFSLYLRSREKPSYSYGTSNFYGTVLATRFEKQDLWYGDGLEEEEGAEDEGYGKANNGRRGSLVSLRSQSGARNGEDAANGGADGDVGGGATDARGKENGVEEAEGGEHGPAGTADGEDVEMEKEQGEESEDEEEPYEATIDLSGEKLLYMEFRHDNYTRLLFGEGNDAFQAEPAPRETTKWTEEKKNPPKEITLRDCLDEFRKQETLEEDNSWYCPKCKEHRQATKKLDIWSLPDILVFHLKRFSNAGRSSFRWSSGDKIEALVDAPVNGLDLKDVVIGPQRERMGDEGELVYDLFAVSNHFGGLGGGHYTAYAKNPLDGSWYNFDDRSVSRVREGDVMTDAAYLLFYQRRKASTHDSLQSIVEQLKNRPPTPEPEPVFKSKTTTTTTTSKIPPAPPGPRQLPLSPSDTSSSASSTHVTMNNSPESTPRGTISGMTSDEEGEENVMPALWSRRFNLADELGVGGRLSTFSGGGGLGTTSFPTSGTSTPGSVGWGYGIHSDGVGGGMASGGSSLVPYSPGSTRGGSPGSGDEDGVGEEEGEEGGYGRIPSERFERDSGAPPPYGAIEDDDGGGVGYTYVPPIPQPNKASRETADAFMKQFWEGEAEDTDIEDLGGDSVLRNAVPTSPPEDSGKESDGSTSVIGSGVGGVDLGGGSGGGGEGEDVAGE